jgi:hypothetical protein
VHNLGHSGRLSRRSQVDDIGEGRTVEKIAEKLGIDKGIDLEVETIVDLFIPFLFLDSTKTFK